MIIEQHFSLLQHHTFHIPATADYFIEYESVEELKAGSLFTNSKEKQVPSNRRG